MLRKKILSAMANAAENACMDSMGAASRKLAYEPKLSEEMKAYKNTHISRIEKMFRKLSK